MLSDLGAAPLLRAADPLAAGLDLSVRGGLTAADVRADSRAALAFGSQDLPALAAFRTSAEAPAGRFPVTLGFMRLTAVLLEAGVADAAMQVGLPP